MKTILCLPALLIVVFFAAPNVFAGPLVEKHRTEQASAIAGVLAAQHELWLGYTPARGGNSLVATFGFSDAATHVQNAATLLQRIDNLPGSYGHAGQSGVFQSIGEGSRLANPLFKQVLFELTMAEKKGASPAQALKSIYDKIGGKLPPELVHDRKNNLLNNLKYVKEAGLDSPENLQLLKDGKAPKPTKGAMRYRDKNIEVDHKVARSIAPQFENELANLRLMPEELNRTKLAGHGPVERKHLDRLQRMYRPIAKQQVVRAGLDGLVVVAGVNLGFQVWQGEDVNWTAVTESGGIGLASSAATVVLAQQIEQRFGKQLAQSFVAKNLLPGLARGSLSGAAASTGVGAVVVLGFVAKDYFTDQITANEAMIQSGIGLGSVSVGVGAAVIATWATAGTVFGSPIPGLGNAAGFVIGAVAGAAVYVGGDWYYENFKLEGIRAEMAAFKQTASKWEAKKMKKEMRNLRETASTLRADAARVIYGK